MYHSSLVLLHYHSDNNINISCCLKYLFMYSICCGILICFELLHINVKILFGSTWSWFLKNNLLVHLYFHCIICAGEKLSWYRHWKNPVLILLNSLCISCINSVHGLILVKFFISSKSCHSKLFQFSFPLLFFLFIFIYFFLRIFRFHYRYQSFQSFRFHYCCQNFSNF